MITFGWEKLEPLLSDGLAQMIEAHWQEVGVHKREVPLDVDWIRYKKLEDTGILRIMAVRKEGKLVGYSSFLCMSHLHYRSTMHATNDAIYVDESERGIGIKLIMECEKALVELSHPNAVRITYHVKEHLPRVKEAFEKIFARLGYGEVETTYDKIGRKE